MPLKLFNRKSIDKPALERLRASLSVKAKTDTVLGSCRGVVDLVSGFARLASWLNWRAIVAVGVRFVAIAKRSSGLLFIN